MVTFLESHNENPYWLIIINWGWSYAHSIVEDGKVRHVYRYRLTNFLLAVVPNSPDCQSCHCVAYRLDTDTFYVLPDERELLRYLRRKSVQLQALTCPGV